MQVVIAAFYDAVVHSEMKLLTNMTEAIGVIGDHNFFYFSSFLGRKFRLEKT